MEGLADMARNLADILLKFIKLLYKLLKTLFKATWKFLKWIITTFGMYAWIIILVVIIALVVVCVISVVEYYLNSSYNKEEGIMSSIGGVKGDSFYGTRYVYFDEEYTSVDLQNIYLEFTYNILNNLEIKSESDLNIDFTKSYLENSQIGVIATSVARDISGHNGTLLECTKLINYYGFEDSDKVLNIMAESIKLNNYSSLEKSLILSKLKSEFDANFSYMKNICAKIMIKDYILGEDETSNNIPKKNYVGFVYMPKSNIILENCSFTFAVDEEKQVNITSNYKSTALQKEISNAVADSTWFKDGMVDKLFDSSLNEYILSEFTAIDKNDLNYLSEPKSLFKIYKDGKFNIYFNDEADSKDVTSLMDNINTTNYFYLKLNADAAYNMAESFVEYK